MKLAANYNHGFNLLESPSIRAALELLSDRDPEEQQGEWLPWLKQQQESGAIGFSHKTATKYMSLAANMNHGSYLTTAPSIRAALELLSDRDPEEQQDNFCHGLWRSLR